MPGIVNLHTHSDRSILRNPGTTSSLLQGVTTECTGMRGGSAFPRAARASDGGAGSDGSDWTDLAGFRERVNSNGTGINLVPLVGHGTVRTCVMGAEGGGGERHFPTPDEMKAMEVLVREAMEQGAFGISRGLIYAPGRNAVPAEVEALCSVVASYGGVHCSHLRSEEDMLIEDLDEMLENVRYAGIPSSVSHHKAMMRRNWGKPTETTRKIARAREEGLEVICDFYPWVISATSSLAGRFGRALGALDPSLSGIASQRKNLLAVLEDERTWALIRQALRDLFREEKAVNDARAAELAPTGAVVRNARDLRFWECIAHSPFHPEFFTLTFEDVAKRLGYDDYRDGMRRLYLEDEGQTTTGVGPTCEEDILTILRSPYSVVSSDSSTSDGRAGGHPRSYANFGYALVRFVKELKAISLEALVKKMTSQPATFVELTDRGVVRPGNWADIVVTDWENFRSTADFAHPHESPVGIRYVLVNGQLAVSEGAVTGVRAGRVIGRG
ncbi:MAG: N-acyl-D-amino-acid deacylase family protein [Bacillota bacterium]